METMTPQVLNLTALIAEIRHHSEESRVMATQLMQAASRAQRNTRFLTELGNLLERQP